MSDKVYSKMDQLPNGHAGEKLTSGCLVVEGGAFRGLYGQGVMDFLMLHDINMQCTIGVSAGAMGGINYVSGQIGRSARINLGNRYNPDYLSFRRYRKYGGIVNFDFVLKNVPNDPLDAKRFYDPERRFVAVVSNLATGKAEYKEIGNCADIMTAVQASASMPYISEKVMLDGNEYLDGGCCVKVPYQWAIEEGYEKIIVIRTHHEDFRYEKDSDTRLPNRFYRNYPEFADSLAHNHQNYNAASEEMQRLNREGRIFMIAPSETWYVDRVEKDLEKLGDWYWLGYHDAETKFEDLKRYMEK